MLCVKCRDRRCVNCRFTNDWKEIKSLSAGIVKALLLTPNFSDFDLCDFEFLCLAEVVKQLNGFVVKMDEHVA